MYLLKGILTGHSIHAFIGLQSLILVCYKNEEYAEIENFRLMIKIQLFCLVAVIYVAVKFHISYSYGLMFKSIKSSQPCE